MNRFKKYLAITAAFIMMLYPASASYAATYTVAKNDNLTKISKLFKTSVKTLKSDNKLKSDKIYPGQKLELKAKTHTVKSGDTMYKLANKYNIALSSLKKANNIYNGRIRSGQKLIIPGVKEDSKNKANNTAGKNTVTKNTTAKNTTAKNTTVKNSTASTTASKASAVSTSATGSKLIPYTSAELDLLARLVEAEAGGEDYKVKVAVAAVVINRVQSKDWASTISGVINEKYGSYYQFTPVQNGMIKKAASDASIKAAREALTGSDPSNGAIYYYDGSSTNAWIKSKTVTARLGNLTFAK